MTDAERLEALCRAVRHCRDQRGDDRCWKDWEAVYALLPEGYTPPVRDETVELEACRAFIRSCHDPRVRYVSPQERIAELEAELSRLMDAVRLWAPINARLGLAYNGARLTLSSRYLMPPYGGK